MTAPSVTYGHGKLEDTWATLADDYTLTDGGSTGSYGVTAGQDFYITLTAFVGDAYLKNDTNLALPTNTYPKILFRYKTLGATAKVVAEFSDASTQTLLSETSSVSWKIVSATLTADKTLDHLSFYCCDDEGSVYYDFFLVCKGVFTFPQYAKLTYSQRNRYSNTSIFTRLGRRKSWVGADELIVNIEGDVDSNRSTWKPTGYAVFAAQILNDIHHNASTEAWQWFKCDRGQFKAVMEDLTITESVNQNYLYYFNTTFSEDRVSDASAESLAERLGTAEL
jgi:hypothetical protein